MTNPRPAPHSSRRSAASWLTWLGACLLCLSPLSAQHLFFTPGEAVSPQVEAVYQRGLDYLVSRQQPTGAWSDGYAQQPGVVGLALLAILAHGDDPNTGPYAVTVKRALDYILKHQNATTGYIGQSMYNHGFATLALAEAYGAVHDDRLGPATDLAVKLILSSQATNALGAWRYSPQSLDADTTVSGACMVALFAARNAGLHVPDTAIRKGLDFYRLCQGADGGFGYTHPTGSNSPRAAIGTLVFGLAREKQSPPWKDAYAYLITAGAGEDQSHYFYYLYYAAQAIFHGRDRDWRTWNGRNLDTLTVMQAADGSWQSNNGPTFATACALLSLALNYRFLPIYER
jgi:hypothetical protein